MTRDPLRSGRQNNRRRGMCVGSPKSQLVEAANKEEEMHSCCVTGKTPLYREVQFRCHMVLAVSQLSLFFTYPSKRQYECLLVQRPSLQ